LQLQTIGIFIEAAVGKGKDIKQLSTTVPSTFFLTWWNKALDQKKVEGRKNNIARPDDKLTTLNDLVFQALGSNTNLDNFVLCNDEINSYKARVWSQISHVAEDKYKQEIESVLNGMSNSNTLHSSFRAVRHLYYSKRP
jgi:hypothetical protein